jgi:hypothetical protein
LKVYKISATTNTPGFGPALIGFVGPINDIRITGRQALNRIWFKSRGSVGSCPSFIISLTATDLHSFLSRSTHALVRFFLLLELEKIGLHNPGHNHPGSNDTRVPFGLSMKEQTKALEDVLVWVPSLCLRRESPVLF